MRSQSRSHIEYLIPTNNVVVLDSYFNLTNKCNLIDRLEYDLIRLFDHLIVAYFFGPPCIVGYIGCIVASIKDRLELARLTIKQMTFNRFLI